MCFSMFLNGPPFSFLDLLGTTLGRSWGSFWRLWRPCWAILGAKLAPKVAQVTKNVVSNFGSKSDVRFFELGPQSGIYGGGVGRPSTAVQLESWKSWGRFHTPCIMEMMRRIQWPSANSATGPGLGSCFLCACCMLEGLGRRFSALCLWRVLLNR